MSDKTRAGLTAMRKSAKRHPWLVVGLVLILTLAIAGRRGFMSVLPHRIPGLTDLAEWPLTSKMGQIHAGMSKEEVYKILGPPGGQVPEYMCGRNCYVWHKGCTSFWVTFDDKDRVKLTESADLSD